MKSLRPTAKPGDMFLLLFPTPDELPGIRSEQARLQTRYGGQLYDDVHITCQRFSVTEQSRLLPMADRLAQFFAQYGPFPIYADSLVQFYADFWKSYVIRWRVQETVAWTNFQRQIDTLLLELGCQIHYPPQRRATCSALQADSAVVLAVNSPDSFPCRLFTAREMVWSRINGPGQFERLGSFSLLEKIS